MTDQPNSRIVVVTGLPRSGTSMMMQMLEAGGLPPLCDQIRVADADNPRGYYEFEPVKQLKTDSRWLTAAAGKAVKIIHLLLPLLPPDHTYAVIFMHRKMEDVLASQAVMLKRRGTLGAALPPAQLAEVFRKQLDQTYRWLNQQPNIRLHRVEYQSVLHEPRAQAEGVGDFLGQKMDLEAMAAVVDRRLGHHHSGDR